MIASQQEISIYNCGGCGIAIGAALEPLRKNPIIGMPALNSYYISTAAADLVRRNVPSEFVYSYKDMDGGGGLRKKVNNEVNETILEVLQKHKPSKSINIVVHSGGGSSGSVIGPLLVKELKKRGESVIVILIGGYEDKRKLDNTINVIKGYEALSKQVGSSVVCYYLENSEEEDQAIINSKANLAVNYIATLYSGLHENLDGNDLKNWLGYNVFENEPPMLASLNFCDGPKSISDLGDVVTVASLVAPGISSQLNIMVHYHPVGIVPTEMLRGAENTLLWIGKTPFHYAISTDLLSKAMKRLTAMQADVSSQVASRTARASFVDNVQADDNGLVL